MKKVWQQILYALGLSVLFPLVILVTVQGTVPVRSQPPGETTCPTEETEETKETVPEQTIPVLEDGEITQMALETYVTRVVLAEMPVSFEPEALKAQAVVARTYALYRVQVSQKHPQGAVCTDYTCCQAYQKEENYTDADLKQIRDAVMATAGQVLTYGGRLAETTYFSCSGGMTEDAKDVWGSDIPYLRAVSSPGEENATHYTDTVTFTLSDFCKKLGVTSANLGAVTYTRGGGVATAVIGGQSFSGQALRSKLGLRSTAATISVSGEQVTVTTKGFGHRVGMSQYGADAMAVTGSSYEEILQHYYPGTELKK